MTLWVEDKVDFHSAKQGTALKLWRIRLETLLGSLGLAKATPVTQGALA